MQHLWEVVQEKCVLDSSPKKFHEQNTEKVEAVEKSKEEDENRESWLEQDP